MEREGTSTDDRGLLDMFGFCDLAMALARRSCRRSFFRAVDEVRVTEIRELVLARLGAQIEETISRLTSGDGFQRSIVCFPS